MDKKRADYLISVAATQQHKALLKWREADDKGWNKDAEVWRQECAAWARAVQELDAMAQKLEQVKV